MVVILGQQYNVGEKPTVILYTYIDRHAGTPDKHQTQRDLLLFDNSHRRYFQHAHFIPIVGVGKRGAY